jgi:hypothetical protein
MNYHLPLIKTASPTVISIAGTIISLKTIKIVVKTTLKTRTNEEQILLFVFKNIPSRHSTEVQLSIEIFNGKYHGGA